MIYEYRCSSCGHEFSKEQRITDNPVKTCPSCKRRTAKRMISQCSFSLKGNGWANDGYAKPKTKVDKKVDKGSS